MPKQLFDGFGNPILAYTQDEVNGLTQQLKNVVEILKKQNSRLTKEKSKLAIELDQAKQKAEKNAEEKVQPAKPNE